MDGEYCLIACPNYPLDGSKELRLLTAAQDVIHLLVRGQWPPRENLSTYLLMIMLGVFEDF